MVKSNIPSARQNDALFAAISASADELDYTDVASPGTAEASKALVVDSSKDISGLNDVGVAGDLTVTGDIAVSGTVGAQAVTATSDGLTTAIIPDGGFGVVAVTSANAAHIVTLPTPTPGTVVIGYVGANGCELRTNAPATVGISGGTPGAAAESAIPANTFFMVLCISATAWLGWDLTGTTLAAIEASAA